MDSVVVFLSLRFIRDNSKTSIRSLHSLADGDLRIFVLERAPADKKENPIQYPATPPGMLYDSSTHFEVGLR